VIGADRLASFGVAKDRRPSREVGFRSFQSDNFYRSPAGDGHETTRGASRRPDFSGRGSRIARPAARIHSRSSAEALTIGEALDSTNRIVDPDPAANCKCIGEDCAQQPDRPGGGTLAALNNRQTSFLSGLSPCGNLSSATECMKDLISLREIDYTARRP
jgi:hypothetical protein